MKERDGGGGGGLVGADKEKGMPGTNTHTHTCFCDLRAKAIHWEPCTSSLLPFQCNLFFYLETYSVVSTGASPSGPPYLRLGKQALKNPTVVKGNVAG